MLKGMKSDTAEFQPLFQREESTIHF